MLKLHGQLSVYYTNETLFTLREKPAHLLITGGGPIGIEMAQAHRRLGCDVTVIEGARALGKDDPDMALAVLTALRDEGVVIEEQTPAARVSARDGQIEIADTTGRVFAGTHVLVAAGRKSNIARLDLGAAGIEVERGSIKVNAGLRTSNRRVYAVGDVAGGLQFTHVAGYHAGVILRPMLLGLPSKAKDAHIPWVTYTSPELAQVGLTEAQALEKYGAKLEVASFDFAHNDRLIAERRAQGRIKVMVVRGRPVGASIVGPQAGELIAMWSLALVNGLKMSQIAGMIAPYPTVSEVNKRAAGAYFAPRLFDSPALKRAVRIIQSIKI